MTLILKTESHGEIESGFYSAFVQFTRIGEYAFVTKHLCDLIRDFAENPDAREGRIIGYNLGKFEERMDEYLGRLIQTFVEQEEESYMSGSTSLDQRLESNEIDIEDEIDIYNEGQIIHVEIEDNGSIICVGEYKISFCHFGIMALYLADGGFMGWRENEIPEFAEGLRSTIKTSQNPLYNIIQERMN